MALLLMSLLITGGLGAFAAFRMNRRTKEKDDLEGSPTYKIIMKLLKDIKNEKVFFEPKNPQRNDYSADHNVGDYDRAYISMLGGQKERHYVVLYAFGKLVMTFYFHADNSIKNVNFKESFLDNADPGLFASELKQAMEMYIKQKDKIKNEEIKLKDVFENINNVPEEENPFKKVIEFVELKSGLNSLISKETQKTLETAIELYEIKESLDVEEKHILESYVNERLYQLLFHFSNMNQEEQEKRQKELLKGIEQIHHKLKSVLGKKKENHQLQFEKQMKLIDK